MDNWASWYWFMAANRRCRLGTNKEALILFLLSLSVICRGGVCRYGQLSQAGGKGACMYNGWQNKPGRRSRWQDTFPCQLRFSFCGRDAAVPIHVLYVRLFVACSIKVDYVLCFTLGGPLFLCFLIAPACTACFAMIRQNCVMRFFC